MNRPTNPEKSRFVACAHDRRWLTIFARTAGRVPVSKSSSPIHLSAGSFFQVPSTPGHQHEVNLTRCGIFRGKISRRQNQNQNRTSKKGRPARQHYE